MKEKCKKMEKKCVSHSGRGINKDEFIFISSSFFYVFPCVLIAGRTPIIRVLMILLILIIEKRALRKAGWDLRESKKWWSRFFTKVWCRTRPFSSKKSSSVLVLFLFRFPVWVRVHTLNIQTPPGIRVALILDSFVIFCSPNKQSQIQDPTKLFSLSSRQSHALLVLLMCCATTILVLLLYR